MSSVSRRPRRAVRPSGTVGTDESVLRSALPAQPAPVTARPEATVVETPGAGRRSPAGPPSAADPRNTVGSPSAAGPHLSAGQRPPAVTRVDAPAVVTPRPSGSDDLWLTTRSADDSDRGWGREEPTSDDERLRREKPPHW